MSEPAPCITRLSKSDAVYINSTASDLPDFTLAIDSTTPGEPNSNTDSGNLCNLIVGIHRATTNLDVKQNAESRSTNLPDLKLTVHETTTTVSRVSTSFRDLKKATDGTSVSATDQPPNADSEEDENRYSSEGRVRSTAKVLSAGLYLFDWVTNVLVLKEYYELHSNGTFDKLKLGARFEIQTFAVSLSFMVGMHIAALVAFKLHLPREERPLILGCFLPLVQLRRLVVGIWETGACRSLKGVESNEAEALYAIMGAAMETAPQLSIQITAIVAIGTLVSSWDIPPTLVISLVASFLSGSYNTGRAVMYKFNMRWTFSLNAAGVAAGVYTFGALLLRCTVAASVVLSRRVSDHSWTIVWIYFFVVQIPVSLINGLISLSKAVDLRSISGQLRLLVVSTVNMVLGPLYPIISAYACRRTLHKFKPRNLCRYYRRIPLVLFINMMLDVGCVMYLTISKTDPCNATIYGEADRKQFSSTLTCSRFVSLVAAGGSISFAAAIAFCTLLIASSTASAAVEDETSLSRRAKIVGDNCRANGEQEADDKAAHV